MTFWVGGGEAALVDVSVSCCCDINNQKNQLGLGVLIEISPFGPAEAPGSDSEPSGHHQKA